MDTFVTPDEDTERREPSFLAALPPELRGEEDGSREAPSLGSLDEAVAPETGDGSVRWWWRRKLLLGSAAAIALVGIGGTVFLASPYDRVYPVPKLASAVRGLTDQVGTKPPLLAPAASLAGINAPVPPPEALPKYVTAPRDEQLHEVLGFHVGEPGALAIVPPASNRPTEDRQPAQPIAAAGSGDTAHGGPGSAAVPPSPSPVVSTPTAAPPLNPPSDSADSHPSSPAAPPMPASPPAATPPPSTVEDALTKTLALQAAPMTPAQQVDVLQTVTRLAVLVRDQKAEVAELRADVAKANADYAAHLDDFSRRLTLVEARKALTSAEQPVAVDLPPASSGASSAQPPVAKAALFAGLTAADGLAAEGSERRGYRIQAASPGLAMLAAVDRGGGDGAQLAVEVGDTLPGWGKVKSVSQSGTAWVVTTEHGTIRQ